MHRPIEDPAADAAPDEATFAARLAAMRPGYREGLHDGRRYGATLKVSADGRRRWLYAEELGGTDFVSANVFMLDGARVLLKPCEMPEEKVVAFVLGFVPAD